MTSLKRIVSKSQILVEGRDAEVFFEEFCRHFHVDHKVQIQNFGGVKELKGFLKTFVNSSRFDKVEALGIIRDAERNDADAARDSGRNSVDAAGLHLSW